MKIKSLLVNFLTVTTLVLATMYVNGVAEAAHYILYNQTYEKCKADLIKAKNYKTQQQVFDCTETSSVVLRVLGTILVREGSYIKYKL